MKTSEDEDAAALEAAGKYYEAAVAYRRQFEALNSRPYVAASEMADVALDMARCFESAGDPASAQKARNLVASLCSVSLTEEEES